MTKIAIIITSFNRKNITLNCLSRLYRQDGLTDLYDISIFLVDDGSTDGTSQAISNQFPMVNLIKGSGDLYWNRGMHLAWKTASEASEDFDHYLWLNDDVVLYENAIQHLLSCASISNFQSIICGVFETDRDSTIISYGGGNLDGKTYIANSLHTAKPQQCDIINGNCVLIPKFVFDKVGFIDRIFPHALGDHDYALRAKKLHIKSFTTTQIIGFCPKNSSLPKWCLASTPLLKRFKILYSPLGNSHPYYYTIYIYRHFGLLKAVKNFNNPKCL